MSNEVFYTLAPEKLLALAAYGEAAREGTEGMMAVINVILNRVKEPNKFADPGIYAATGSLIHAVVLQPKQFSVFNADILPKSGLLTLLQNFDYNAQYNSVLNQAYQLGQLAVSGMLQDNVYGAQYYYNPSLVSPSWANTMNVIGLLGNHVFLSTKSAVQRVQEVYTTGAEYVEQQTGVNPTYVLAILMAGLGGLLIIRKRRS